jgi:GNAT superfamily N-acetyltransferase
MVSVVITQVKDLPEGLDSLIDESLDQGLRFVERLRYEWVSGVNRFSLLGEALFVARTGQLLVGVCGLNRDPYTGHATVGRLRRLYVSGGTRRSGVGRALVRQAIEFSRANFETLQLRSQLDAFRLYEALGFREVVGNPYVTHRMNLRQL